MHELGKHGNELLKSKAKVELRIYILQKKHDNT